MNRKNFQYVGLMIALALLSVFIGKSSLAGQTDGLLKALQAIGFAPVAQTGQTALNEEGDDGDLQMGIVPNHPRYIDNGDGTVTDTFTNLMWVQNAQFFGIMNWYEAIEACNNMSFADYDDWRMPNVREMLSLIDYGYNDPSLTPGHPFINVPQYPGVYWSSTTYAGNNDVFHVPISNGTVNHVNKIGLKFVWPVRGGY
jgi:hypothetical protein